MKQLHRIIILASAMFLVSHVGLADTAYITDTFRISLRRGPSVENKILKFLPSGLAVEIKETQDGWDRIQIKGGEDDILEGWVLSRYLVNRLPWEVQTRSLLQENAELRNTLAGIEERHEQDTQQLKTQLKTLADRYEEASTAVRSLNGENQYLKSSQQIQWFVAGVAVLLLGILIGVLSGRQKRRSTSSYLR